MNELVFTDVISHEEYEARREEFRRRIIELKRRRRVSVGDRVTLVFENRETVRFQVQEMVRIERIFDKAKIQEELDVYNALLPGDGELSATLFIEITESEAIKRELDSFQGIDQGDTVALKAGPCTAFARFEGGHSKEDKISAVHFVKFHPDRAFVEALEKGLPAFISIVHGPYRAEQAVSEDMRREWLADLRPDLARTS